MQRESWHKSRSPDAWSLEAALPLDLSCWGVIHHLIVEACVKAALLLLVAVILTNSSDSENSLIRCPKASKGCQCYLINWIDLGGGKMHCMTVAGSQVFHRCADKVLLLLVFFKTCY